MWRYTDLLNQDIQILLEIGLGIVTSLYGPFSAKNDAPTLKTLVFNILLPISVMTDLGFVVDFRDGSIWRFIGSFLMMRALVLLLDVVWAVARKQSFSHISMNWMVTSWVSTTILGPPMLQATLGQDYQIYGPIAAVSSVIFQLPLLILFFELDAVPAKEERLADQQVSLDAIEDSGAVDEREDEDKETMPLRMESHVFYKTRLSRRHQNLVVWNLVRMPLMWSIVGGVILSVTTLGPKYLYPGTTFLHRKRFSTLSVYNLNILDAGPTYSPNCDYVPATGFIYLFFSTLQKCLEPIALFSVGIVIVSNHPFRKGWIILILYMLIKFILVPVIMVGCAKAFSLSEAEGRAAVLISVLPISPPVFALAGHYDYGLSEAVTNVVLGKLLFFPAVLAWEAFMNAVALFPVAMPTVSSVCPETTT